MKKILIFLTFMFIFSCSNIDQKSNNAHIDKSQTKKILALWDSLTAWYWLDISESYPLKLDALLKNNWYEYDVINAGVSWNTSDDLLSRLNLYDQDYDIVIILIWWNDWLRWNSLINLEDNINKIIDHFDNKNTKIILWWLTILPENLWYDYINEFKNVYEQISKNNKNIFFINDFLKDVAWNSKYNLDDKIHPNSSWYDIIVNNLLKFMQDNNLLIK